jgi:hypothetical protein
MPTNLHYRIRHGCFPRERARGEGFPEPWQALGSCCADQGSIRGSRPMAFLGRARGHSVDLEASPRWGKPRLSLSWMLTLVGEVPPGTLPTPAPETLRTRWPWKNGLPGQGSGFPTLSLWLHTFRSVVASFLPKAQNQRGQLAGHLPALPSLHGRYATSALQAREFLFF